MERSRRMGVQVWVVTGVEEWLRGGRQNGRATELERFV